MGMYSRGGATRPVADAKVAPIASVRHTSARINICIATEHTLCVGISKVHNCLARSRGCGCPTQRVLNETFSLRDPNDFTAGSPAALVAATPAELGKSTEPTGPSFWQRLTDPLWRLAGGGRQPPAPPVDLPLPVDKLTCKMAARWVVVSASHRADSQTQEPGS